MRKLTEFTIKAMLCAVATFILCVPLGSQSKAKGIEIKATTERVVQGMCGGGIQTGGGHSGCSICTAKNCADYDCSKKGCTITVFIKGKPGTTTTGYNGTKKTMTTIDRNTDDDSGRRPINTYGGAKPIESSGNHRH